MSKSPPPAKTSGAIIFTNDYLLDMSRTIHYLGMACRRTGVRPFVRDTADNHWMNELYQQNDLKDSKDLCDLMVTSKYVPFAHYAGIDRILSFNMEWLLTPESFLDLPDTQYAISLWENDLRDVSSKKIIFKEKKQKELLSDAKVHHFFSNEARWKEAKRIDFPNLAYFKPAAPAEFLDENHECIHKDLLAYLPSFQPPTPSQAALESFKQNANLETLRKIARDEILQHPCLMEWKKGEAKILNLIEAALDAKMKAPFESVTDFLFQKESPYSPALARLNEWDVLLEASALVKSVFKYDMPAIVCRLANRGCLDVYGDAKAWEPYGIQTKGNVKSRDIVNFYQSYIGHLYLPDATREETLHVRLFEIAACARCAFALNNPDLKECFMPNEEIIIGENAEELEQKIAEALQHPDTLFDKGKNARARVKKEHTWDHRLKKIFGTIQK